MNAELMGACDDVTSDVISRTLERLPAEVADFARRFCLFVAFTDRARGLCVPFEDHWIPLFVIVLAMDAMRGPWAADIVAHEIAHAWAEHGRGISRDEAEVEADAMAVQWGFASKADRSQQESKR